MADLSILSNQTIWQPVTLTHPTEGAQDPRTYDVEFAVVAFGTEPVEDDWFPAAWEADFDDSGRPVAHAEVGPEAETVVLTVEVGLYRAWVRIHLPTETPVIGGGTILAY